MLRGRLHEHTVALVLIGERSLRLEIEVLLTADEGALASASSGLPRRMTSSSVKNASAAIASSIVAIAGKGS
jgi:hypothetical protein